MTGNTRILNVSDFAKMKSHGEKIAMLTAYDYPTAALLDESGADMILVGDSLGMVVQGHETTLSVTLDAMIYHAEMVARACRHAMVVVDIPFPFCQLGPEEAVRAAARIMKETKAGAVKIEGGAARAHTVRAVVDAGIPVMGHCGLMPQSVRRLGGYKVQREEKQLQDDTNAVVEAGVFAVVLECVGASLARAVTAACPVPTIGIGAGNGCDGQVLVFHDFLHLATRPRNEHPRHVRVYADLAATVEQAARDYIADVKSGVFPGDDESFH
ncbi:MAG: 3-methyl-2-oxobutanoate hydroxymethyltransferase [Planctomycetia bacterium]|nr:3-methyl-2-oxobutanoate hydroxymethyltransferase [Planctomycetia bacterium]